MSVTNRTIIVGGIESKSGMSVKDGKQKPWTRYSVKDQSDKFVGSTFSETIVGVLKANIGKQVTLEIEERENPDPERQPFRDIVGAMPGVIASAAEAMTIHERISKVGINNLPPTTAGPTDRAVRSAALAAAVQYVALVGNAEAVLVTADKFLSWITEAEQVQHMPFDPERVEVPL